MTEKMRNRYMGSKAQEGKHEGRSGTVRRGRDRGTGKRQTEGRAEHPAGPGVGLGRLERGALAVGIPRGQRRAGSRGLREAWGSRGIARC